MDAFECIITRVSVRSYEKKDVPNELIGQLLESAVRAPSAGNVQPWEFIVIDDRKIIEQIAGLKYQRTLKMRIDQMVLDNPDLIETIYQQTMEPLSVERISGQKNNYLNSTVVAICNKKGHGIGRKSWMNIT